MKKQTPQEKIVYIRIARKRQLRNMRKQKQGRAAIAPASRFLEFAEALPKPNNYIVSTKRPLQNVRVIEPPCDFSLRRNFDAVAGFMQHFRKRIYGQYAIRRREFTRIDFTKIEKISPSAALILAAELDRWQNTNRMRLTPHEPEDWDPAVGRMLFDLGLFDLLDIDCPDVIKSIDSADFTKILKYIRMKVVDPARLGEMLEHLTEIAGKIRARNFIYDGLIEALKNAKQHAYIEDRWYGVGLGTSWMTGAYNPRKKRLSAAVYDCGVGIPETLPKSGIWEQVTDVIASIDGNECSRRIAAALKVGRSRTGEAQRGNGLPTMMRLIDQLGGELRIISGAGEVLYLGNDIIKCKSLPGKIGGTLIEWRIDGNG